MLVCSPGGASLAASADDVDSLQGRDFSFLAVDDEVQDVVQHFEIVCIHKNDKTENHRKVMFSVLSAGPRVTLPVQLWQAHPLGVDSLPTLRGLRPAAR